MIKNKKVPPSLLGTGKQGKTILSLFRKEIKK